jgi:hypothetical protein
VRLTLGSEEEPIWSFPGLHRIPCLPTQNRWGAAGQGNTKASDEKCEKCGEFLVIKKNRFGKMFLACPNYPKCTYAKSIKKKPAAPQGRRNKIISKANCLFP